MPQKRFIAGATCPSCGTFDTVYILKNEGAVSRHCTRCDLDEAQPVDGEPTDPVSQWKPVTIKGD